MAGEYSIALQIFNNHAVISAAQGAPVAWIPMNPAMGVLSVVSVTAGAPHPNAGKLLVDFLASPDGQNIFRDADYIPVDPAVPPKDREPQARWREFPRHLFRAGGDRGFDRRIGRRSRAIFSDEISPLPQP